MLLKNKKKYEKEILELFKKDLDEKKKAFLKRDIRYKTPELVILKENNDDYTSEVRTYFYKNEELIDILEFFIFFNGVSETSTSEFETWFIEELNNIGEGWKIMD